MAGHYIRTRARTAGWAWSFAAFAVALIPVGIVLFRLNLLDLQNLSWTLLLAGGLAAFGLLLALMAIAKVWRRGAVGGGRAVSALVVASIALLPFAGAAFLYRQYPEGSSAETAGLVDAALAPVASAPTSPDAVLAGRDYQATASMVYEAARTTLEQEGIEITDVASSLTPPRDSEDLGVSGTVQVPVPTLRGSLAAEAPDRFAMKDAREYTIQAVAYAPIFAFPSDVTIRIAEEGAQTFIDMRSASRDLDRDLGQNRRIIVSFLNGVDEAMRAAEGIVPEE
ncbi:DUF1499 domain-containing protein [Aureimonas phyllosphaerae]|uniref:DUF1499 domain-containing protein n=1 Tax=Aureimonas phyllosphaerae TaxID=1166078 RepID=A0A7W6BQH3_9HYPH|nr:DUF1499 domain-containing protein [Aureimonas phyllosphaerae]MBB3935047.1 hypothetical protein [Aureimonas phyllosphaerae]MBB3959055.1 hypothetical protein [Aureimonas phyllosphaerae]SFF08515.1 Protein of unknown function [Aureimonas phyllosphaerae]